MFGLMRSSRITDKIQSVKDATEKKCRKEYEEQLEELRNQFEFDKKVMVAAHTAEIKTLENKLTEYKVKVKQAQEVWQWCRTQTQSNKMVSSELSLAVAELHMTFTDLMRRFAYIEDTAKEHQESITDMEVHHKKQLGLMGDK